MIKEINKLVFIYDYNYILLNTYIIQDIRSQKSI